MRKLLLTLAFLLVPVMASADHYADLYVIPAGGHTPGANGTMWMSDIAIQNFQATALDVQIVFIEGGFENADNVYPVTTETVNGSVSVPPNGSVLLKDVVNGHRGMTSTTGAFIVGADRPFAVTSRSYSMAPTGDTVGQTVTPARDFIENTTGTTTLSTAVAYVPGLIQSARFRSNLGFVAGNSSAAPMTMSVTVRDGSGAVAGTRNFTIESGTFVQTQFPVRDFVTRTFDVGSAEFRITSGSGAVVPYASVIDNSTADAVFVSGVFPDNVSPSGKSGFPESIFRSLFESVRRR
ncbi:MAG TPA: hypothetical protein VGF69_08000 [Thermoanaerobaculia bacterium]|jgi:hypothetical protein